MLVALAFFAGDVKQAQNLLRFIGQLGGVSNHDALLVADSETPWNEARDCHRLAKACFKSVHSITNGKTVEGWIPGSCSLFKTAAVWCAGRPFLFLEPDAAMLRPTWLDEFEAAYAACGKPFMGALIHHQQPGWPNPYLEGCAVYPANAWEIMEKAWLLHISWTRSCAPLVVPLAVNTPLIHHVWGQMREAPTFSDVRIGKSHTLADIRPGACLFHRCKDGSLIRLLRKKMGIVSVGARSVERADVVSLRRNGDIIALLPLLGKLTEKKGSPIRLVVHRDFMPLLEGTSAVEAVQWDGEWEDPLGAAKKFHATNAQVFGKGIPPRRAPANFVTEAWKILGYEWNRYLPMPFDGRDAEREQRLSSSAFKSDKPKILVKLHGFSSPFPHAEFVTSMLKREFDGVAELVWLDNIKAERFYDMIGLMDGAACMVSVDTAMLHINRGHRIPTVSLINGSPWGSTPRCGNVVCRVSYAHVQAKWPLVSEAIRNALTNRGEPGKIVLAYSHWTPRNPDTKRRMDDGFATWHRLGARLLPYAEGRNSGAIGDPHAMPYMRDMVAKAMETGPEQIIAITNNDIQFDERLRAAVLESCKDYGCYWAYRLNSPGGETDNGLDFVAFTRQWWALHQELFPDFLMGYCWWDDMCARIMQWSGCEECERLVYHEPHPWAAMTRPATPGAKHNERLAMEWQKRYGEPFSKPIDLLKAL